MSFFEKFGITFGNKKDKLLPEPTDTNVYKTLATFDLTIESPKFEGAIPEATIKFYPLK